MLDLSSAFNSIPHSLLRLKLERMGIRGTAGDLISDFLRNRPQHAKVLNFCSPQIKVDEFSCPQGTVMSPTLFNLFINDMLKLPLNGTLIAYADDAALLCSEDSLQELYKKANDDFLMIQNWLNDNGLTLNKSKTVYLEFNVRENHSFVIDGIESVSQSKYLGVIIDSKLKWDHHSNFVTSKIRKTIHKFLLLRRVVNQSLLKSVYFAIVEPHLSYGIMAWGGATKNVLDPINKAQKKILKIMLRKPILFPTVELYKLAEVLTPKQIFVKHALIQTHKNRGTLLHTQHTHNTRWLSTLPLNPLTNSRRTTDKQAAQVGITHYNLLPINAKELNSYQFKKFLKKWIPANIF